MIPRQHQWQSHYGATRRKKIDTPPLEGCRFNLKWISVEIHLLSQQLSDHWISIEIFVIPIEIRLYGF